MARPLLTDLELMLLLAALRLGDDAYGIPIAREIRETAGREVAMAVVYATFDRLERGGLVTSRWGEPTAERGGRAKKFFQVTGQGLRQVRATQQALVALWRNLPQLKGRPA
jgi:PadR family transcriptional regulator, regulatory protein PadR